MYSYMEYIERRFLEKCGVTPNDSYANFVLSSSNILDFRVPTGSSIFLGAQQSPNTFNTYSLSNKGSLNGSMSFLFSSMPVDILPSSQTPLHQLTQQFIEPAEPLVPESRATLLYGKMFLSEKSVEAMAIHKPGPGTQLVAKWVCDPRLVSPVILTSTLQKLGKNSLTEFIYSSHENLLGVQGLYNLKDWSEASTFHSRLAAGFEVFYAANKKAPGVSAALRYSSYSKYTATPLTVTTVINPLMGNISVAYALKPTTLSGLSSRFDFNFYSYESDLSLGCELWRTEPVSALVRTPASQGIMSVFKASTALASQVAKVLWETSFKDFLVSTGASLCYGDRNFPIQFGVELVYAAKPEPKVEAAELATAELAKGNYLPI